MGPQFGPQTYGIRTLIDNRVDTLDHINELVLDVRQRWQTKRGYPELQHIIDWMTLDVQFSVFPQANRDNSGSTVGLIQYDWVWNIGDRTALASNGWVDPFDNGARVFSVGGYYNRTDRTNFYLGFTYIEPLKTEAVSVSVTYIFSPKYSMTLSSTYDFGTSGALSNQLVLTRYGSDLQVSLGATFNALTNSFGVVAEVVPNLVPANRRTGLVGTGPGGLLGRC